MTKIKHYRVDSKISGSDKWIGSDADASGRTKNFTPTVLSEYYNKGESIDQSNSMRFVYDTVEVGEQRKSGSFSFESEVGASVDMSLITKLVFHRRTLGGSDTDKLFEGSIASNILIQKAGNQNIFGKYKLLSYVQDPLNLFFYTATFKFVSGNGTIEQDQDYFVSLLDLEGGDKTYEHSQDVASNEWNVSHNLNKNPSVTVVISNGVQGYANVEYINKNNLTITFAGDETGKAYIN